MKTCAVTSFSLLFVTLLILSLACIEPHTTLVPESTKSAEVTVTALDINPAVVMPGDKVAVTATVKNNGQTQGTYTATLTIGNQELERKDVLVPPGATETVAFEIDAPQDSGEYKLHIGAASAILTVFAWSPYILQHDQNKVAQYNTWCGGPVGFLSHFQTPSSFFRIRNVKIYGYVEGRDLRNWQERNFTLKIWNKDLSKELWSRTYPYSLFTVNFPNWVDVQVPDLRVDGDFCVEVITNCERTPDGKQAKCGLFVGLDLSAEEANADLALNGVIQPWTVKEQSGTSVTPHNRAAWMVRVEGDGGPKLERYTLRYDDGTMRELHISRPTLLYWISGRFYTSSYSVYRAEGENIRGDLRQWLGGQRF